MGIKFLAHLCIPFIRDEKYCKDFLFYFINLETYSDVWLDNIQNILCEFNIQFFDIIHILLSFKKG